MNVIIFDFEVFKFDALLGAKILDTEKITSTLWQSWDLDEMKQFYNDHKDYLWVGHNNDAYDNHILAALLRNEDLYKQSQSLIKAEFRPKAKLDAITYDLMCCRFYSLKMTELLIGKRIHTTEVDFNLDRPLTDEEKHEEEGYNLSDLNQTEHNFYELIDPMILRLNLLKEFKIDKYYLTATEARLAALALGAKKRWGLEKQYVAPKVYDTLQVENPEVMKFYLTEGFREGRNYTFTICGVEHKMGAGGLHGAIKKCHETDFLYLDVSGYYNLVMINYDLLPRTIPPEGKKLYEYMYHQQLALKGVDDAKRWVYKTILLAVFGASINPNTDFYDPQIGTLITITGQMFIIDLLEKLDGKVKLIQSNTDGIMVKPLSGYTDDDILTIVKEWCSRTGFVIKPKKVKEIYQRDVNCYCYKLPDGSTDTKGDAFIGSWAVDEPVKNAFYTAKESAIVAKATLAYLMHRKLPEETVMENKDNLLLFQRLAKKESYSYCKYETINVDTGEVTQIDIGDLNRVFALKYDGTINHIMKYKISSSAKRAGQLQKTVAQNMPDNYFIYNEDVLCKTGHDYVQERIDYQYYIRRTYERIAEFINYDEVKKIL